MRDKRVRVRHLEESVRQYLALCFKRPLVPMERMFGKKNHKIPYRNDRGRGTSARFNEVEYGLICALALKERISLSCATRIWLHRMEMRKRRTESAFYALVILCTNSSALEKCGVGLLTSPKPQSANDNVRPRLAQEQEFWAKFKRQPSRSP